MLMRYPAFLQKCRKKHRKLQNSRIVLARIMGSEWLTLYFYRIQRVAGVPESPGTKNQSKYAQHLQIGVQIDKTLIEPD